MVCNPRRNALLKEGSKSDKVDARKLADLLRSGMLRPVYHGENGLRTLRELARSYQTIGKDLIRVMNRLKALYRGSGIACCQEKRLLPAPRRDAGVVTYIQPSHSRKGDWFGRFGSPQIAAAMPTPVACCPNSTVSCRSGLDTIRCEATQANRWLKCQPSSYVRLEAYGFFGLSEGA